ncbi:MAG: beta-propeller fold lactonase family protein [Hydrogenophilales bacterium]|nr:beta-propeller fold lactonase family protein [Hydrogenophilales bacterium]
MALMSMTGCSTLGFLQSKHQYAYVANSSNVSAYRINSSTGKLTPLPGSPFAAGILPSSVMANPAGTFVYVANSGSSNVSAYRINASNGTLTPVPGSPFNSGPFPASITFNPAGTFVYVATGAPDEMTLGGGIVREGRIWAYCIDASSGALTPVPGNPFAAGVLPSSLMVNPAGTFAYATNGFSDDVSAYRINSSTGELTPVPGSPFSAGILPSSVTVNPAGTFVYVANSYSSNVSAYRINASTGALAEIPGSPFHTGKSPSSIAVNSTGTFVYVVNQFTGYAGQNGTISTYRINATNGALTEIPGSPFTAGIEPASITINPAGTLAYVANQGNSGHDGSISAYRINATTGVLTPVPGSPFTFGTKPASITIVQP